MKHRSSRGFVPATAHASLSTGQVIRMLRNLKGWTQEQLADTAGVSRQSINSIERNRYVPSLELALIFARIFQCPTDDIFRLENNHDS